MSSSEAAILATNFERVKRAAQWSLTFWTASYCNNAGGFTHIREP
jgi:hypothetical protein